MSKTLHSRNQDIIQNNKGIRNINIMLLGSKDLDDNSKSILDHISKYHNILKIPWNCNVLFNNLYFCNLTIITFTHLNISMLTNNNNHLKSKLKTIQYVYEIYTGIHWSPFPSWVWVIAWVKGWMIVYVWMNDIMLLLYIISITIL